MSVEARRATGAALRGHLRDLCDRHAGGRCRAPLPPRALEEWVGRETASFRAAAVAPRARPGRRRPARPRRPARGPAADQRRGRRRAGDRGGAHRRQRLRPGAGLGPQPAGVAAGRLRAAGGGDPRPAATARGHGRRTQPLAAVHAVPWPGASPPGPARRGRLHAGDDARPAGADGAAGLAAAMPDRHRGSTSATSRSSISPMARSPASPTSRSSPAPMRWRSRRAPASGRCCRPGSPS